MIGRTALVLRIAAAGLAALASSVDSAPPHPRASGVMAPIDSGATPQRGSVTAQMGSVTAELESPSEAAIRVVMAMPRLLRLDPSAAEVELRALSTAEDAERLAAELRGDLRRLAEGFPGGPTAYWVGPLATRAAPLPGGRVRVDVWYTQAVAPPRLAPYADWRIGRLELMEERGGWRLASFEDLPGPRPRALSGQGTSREALFGELAGFAEVGGG